MNKKLILEPLNGLANRLRAIASGIALLERYDDLKLDVAWEINEHLAAQYEDLFKPIYLPRLHIGQVCDYPLLTICRSEKIGLQRRVISPLRNLRGITASESFAMLLPEVKTQRSRLALRTRNTAILRTCQQFVDFPQWQYFVPRTKLQIQINELSESLGNQSIGIHIRRSDNSKSWEKSPLSTFITLMKGELEESPATRFFLATDSEDVRTALIHIFGKNTVLTRHGVNLSRDKKVGMEDAVIDMWTLSKTKRIFGSYWSSFSRVSGRIGNVPFSYCMTQ